MEQQEKAKTGGKQRRSTVGDRLGGNGNIGNKNQQTSQQNQQQTQSEQHQDTAQLGQVTQQLKDVNINQQQPAEGELGATNDGTGDGNAGRNRAAKQFEDKEIRFDPPWDFKLGQMQQVVRNLQRHSHILLENRGSVIIRCYPYKSATYMHLVYQLIYEMLSINQQMGQACSPTEIRPILLHYDDNGLPNPEQQPAAPYSSMPQINQQPNWTDIVLVRVRFDQQSPSIAFLQNFNRNVCRAFDRRQVRCPFAHPDLTQPERILRHRLQQICLEKNGGFNRRRRNRFNYNYNNNHSNEPRFFHNGLQIYKEHSNGYIEPVPFDNYTEIQCLHVVVASLRKYATLYREKETSVIMQNIDLEELDEADMERITKLVYLVVNTDEYRQRCQIIQERIKSRQIGLKTSMTNMAEGNQRDPHEFLPEKIERLPRRKRGGPPAQTTTKKESPKKTNGSGGSDGSGEEGRGNDQQKEDEEEKKEERQQNEKKEETAKVVERPPLVRIQFRNKESAAAFCQLFKTCQEQQKKVEMEKNAEGERGHSAADSYSDLSDLEGVFSSEEEYNEEEEGEEGGTEDTEKKNKAKEKKKKQKARRRQPKMCLYFPKSFAHRDLTPPELALGYALRQFCREKNAEIVANNGPSSSNVAGGSGTNDGGQQQRRFFTRLGRIYERIYGTDMDGNVAAAAASPKEG